MIPRFLNKEEIDYAKMFKNNDPRKATCFNYQTDNKKFNAMLTKAIKRGTPVTLEELYEYLGGKENYDKFVEFTREYYGGYGYKSPL